MKHGLQTSLFFIWILEIIYFSRDWIPSSKLSGVSADPLIMSKIITFFKRFQSKNRTFVRFFV